MESASLHSIEDSNVWDDLENAYLHYELAMIKAKMVMMAHHYEMIR